MRAWAVTSPVKPACRARLAHAVHDARRPLRAVVAHVADVDALFGARGRTVGPPPHTDQPTPTPSRTFEAPAHATRHGPRRWCRARTASGSLPESLIVKNTPGCAGLSVVPEFSVSPPARVDIDATHVARNDAHCVGAQEGRTPIADGRADVRSAAGHEGAKDDRRRGRHTRRRVHGAAGASRRHAGPIRRGSSLGPAAARASARVDGGRVGEHLE